KHNDRFAREMVGLPEVLECHHVTGHDSYLLKVKTENAEALDRLISEKLRIIPGVTRTHTTIAMSSVKECTRVEPPAAADQGKRRGGAKDRAKTSRRKPK